MSSAYYSTTPAIPINMPAGKSPVYGKLQYPQYRQVSASPPEAPESVTTSGGVPSYVPSTASSDYAASASDYETSSASAAQVDLLDYMNHRLSGAFDPVPLDRGLVKQAQTSGELNAKTRELLELQALAQRRLAATRANFADGIKAAKDVQRDLQWTQKRVSQINQRAQSKYPAEYAQAAARYPAPVDF